MAREAYGVFEGGGVKGIALVGALKAAEELGFTFRAVAGTSAGAIVASLVAAGYKADELRSILTEKNFKDFMDPVASGFTGWIPGSNLASAWNAMGLYKGDHFHDWIREKLSLKIFGNKRKSPTFNDLLGKTGTPLEVVAIELISQEVRTFESHRNANLHVADVVRMSMSIPFFFVPYRLGTEMYVDGGVISNFPAWVFKDVQATESGQLPILGFRLEADESTEIPNILKFGWVLIGAIQTIGEKLLNKNTLNVIPIQLPTMGIGTTDFDLTDESKEHLYRWGYDRAKGRLLESFPPTP